MDSAETPTGGASTRTPGGHPDAGAWLLVGAFVVLVLSVALPAVTGGDLAALVALLFMLGLAASVAGSALAFAASVQRGRAVFGCLVLLAGIVGLYGVVPAVAALIVVLLGVALQIASLPND